LLQRSSLFELLECTANLQAADTQTRKHDTWHGGQQHEAEQFAIEAVRL
jgi:hypothetical protein